MEENKIDLVDAFKKLVKRHDTPGFAWITNNYIRISVNGVPVDITLEKTLEEKYIIMHNTLEQEITANEFKELYVLAKEKINKVDYDALNRFLKNIEIN